MKVVVIFGLILLISSIQVLLADHHEDDGQDDPQSNQDTHEDTDNGGQDDTEDWNTPGREFPDAEDIADGVKKLTDKFNDIFDETEPQPASQKLELRKMFQSLRKMLDRVRHSQNGNSQGQGQGHILPPGFAHNPCFKSPEKLKEFAEEVAELIPGPDDEREDHLSEDLDEELREKSIDFIEHMSDFALQCFAPMLNNHTKSKMCLIFSKKSVNGFNKLMNIGTDCLGALLDDDMHDDDDDDDLDDDDLDLPHQMLLMKHMKMRPFGQWTKQDVDNAFQLAPETMDDDIIEGLSDDVFENSIPELGRLVLRRQSSPEMQMALRDRIRSMVLPSRMDTQDLTRLGPGLVALDPDDIDDITPETLAEVDFSKMDLDLDDDDPRSLAIGRVMRSVFQKSPQQLSRTDLSKMMPFMKNDHRLLRSLDANVLAESLTDLTQMDIDEDEARPICHKLREAPEWDEHVDITKDKLIEMGPILVGCGMDFFDDLASDSVTGALQIIKDVDFEYSKARTLLGKLNIGKYRELTAGKLREVGMLAKALVAEEIREIPDNVITETLEDLEKLDLDDWKRKILVHKAITGNMNKLPTNLLRFSRFANALGAEDIAMVDRDTIKNQIAEISKLKLRATLASVLYHKLQTPQSNFNVGDLRRLGRLVIGMSEEDITNMPIDKMSVLNLASTLGNYEDDLSRTKAEAVSLKIQEAFDFDNHKTVEMDENEVLQMAPFLQYLPPAQFDKIKMSLSARKAFLTAMNHGAKTKISRKHLGYLTRQAEDMLSYDEYLMTDPIIDWDEKKVAKMTGLMLGMSPSLIKRLPGNAFIRNLQGFSQVPLTRSQALAVINRVQEQDTDWLCKRERLAQLGAFLKYLSEDKVKTICKGEMASAASAVIRAMDRDDDSRQERMRQGFMREEVEHDHDGEKRIISLIEESLNSDPVARRRRRRSPISGPYCDDIKTLGKKAVMLSHMKLEDIENMIEFPNCFEHLGSLSGWNKDQLYTLTRKAQKVFSHPSSWSPEIVRQAGSIIAGLTPQEISQMKFSTLDAIASAGKHDLFSPDQLKAGFYRWLNKTKNSDMNQVTAPELASLGSFICALRVPDILLLSTYAIRGALDKIGQVKICDISQLRAFATKVMEIYGGNVGSWKEHVVADMGVVIGGLQPNQIRMLTMNQIAVIPTEVIPYFSPDIIHSFTTDQLNEFSSNQATAITQEQFRHLSEAKQVVISGKASVAFDTNPSGGTASLHHLAVSTVVTLTSLSLLL